MRPRPRPRLSTSVGRWLETPRYVALGLVSALVVPFGRLNVDLRRKHEMLAPWVESLENSLAWAVVASVPVVFVLVHLRWRRLSAPRATKRRHLVRSFLSQVAACAVAVAALCVARPMSLPLLASTVRGDATGYVYRSPDSCAYDVAVSDGSYAVVRIERIGPFPCDAPTPRVELRDGFIALVDERGTDIGTWRRGSAF